MIHRNWLLIILNKRLIIEKLYEKFQFIPNIFMTTPDYLNIKHLNSISTTFPFKIQLKLFKTKLFPPIDSIFIKKKFSSSPKKVKRIWHKNNRNSKKQKKEMEKVTISCLFLLPFLLFSSHANVSSGRRFHSIIVCECVCGCYIQ